MDKKLSPVIGIIGGMIVAVVVIGLLLFGMDTSPTPTPAASVSPDIVDDDVDAAPAKPYFDTVRISRQGTGVIAGGQSPGARIILLANDQELMEGVADENGEFVFIIEEPLAPGAVEFNLHGYPAGSDTYLEPDVLAVTDVAERDVRQFVEKSQNDTITALVDKTGAQATRVIQQPQGPALTAGLVIHTVDFGGGNQTIVAGRAVAEGRVAIYLDDQFAGAATADRDGRWEVRFAKVITPGQHKLVADQLLEDGKVQLRAIQPFEAGQGIDFDQGTGGVVIKSGNTLWQIARLVYGGGPRFALIFRGNTDQISDPNLIFPGQIFELPEEAGRRPNDG